MNAIIGKRRSLILLGLTIAVLIAAILASGRFHVRLDLSADGTQTLSKLSRNLYKEIPERVRLTYYLSPALEARYPGPRAVKDLLREFESASRGKISLVIADPAKDPGSLESLGLQAQRMQVVERNEQRLALVFSGIVVEYLDRTEVLPFVFDASTLEYDLVKALRRAVSARPLRAAIIVGDGDKSFETDYRNLAEALRRAGWDAQELPRGAPVPPETQVLFVLGNSALEDYDVYRLDEHLARGGAALVAVKGVDISARDYLAAAPLERDALLRALSTYGVEVKRSLVLDRSSLTVPFQENGPLGGAAIRYVRYPHWIVTRPEFAAKDNPLTANLAGLDLFWPSPLELSSRPGVAGELLLSTSPKAWLQTGNFTVRPEESSSFDTEAETTTGSYGLVAALSGVLPPAFPGTPPSREGAEALAPVAEGRRPAHLLVVGSADFATDLMGMTGSDFNAGFLAQAADWLASGDELASIRSRGGRDPRLVKIEDPAGRSLAILLAYALNVVLVPAAFAAYGLLRLRRRRALAREAQTVGAGTAFTEKEPSSQTEAPGGHA